jgi:hypothetical protein
MYFRSAGMMISIETYHASISSFVIQYEETYVTGNCEEDEVKGRFGFWG